MAILFVGDIMPGGVPRPMYYPETAEECHSLKRLWSYPKHLKESVVAVWKPKNRIGMMVEMEIGQKMRTSYRLTCFTADNILHLYESKIRKIKNAFLGDSRQDATIWLCKKTV